MTATHLLLAFLLAILAGVSFAQEVDPLRAVADRNDDIAARIEQAKKAIDEPASTLADLRKAKTDLEQKMHWVERRASVYSLGQEFAQTPHLGEPTSP
ncbi:MAG: hypothetical protein ABTS16_19985 [Candidatus Accumulibacter phosphatis]|uniref:hypothetical protein n=1 Tax=Candidatus Accumulibacter contiguus TaxID=2954381 RepID=UPI001A648596|nr:hypothetical protein [Accumulibacter sp.]